MKEIRITVVSGPAAGKHASVRFGQRLLVGASSDCGFCVPDDPQLDQARFVLDCNFESIRLDARGPEPITVDGRIARNVELERAQLVSAGSTLFIVKTVDIPLNGKQKQLLGWVREQKVPVFSFVIEQLHDPLINWMKQFPAAASTPIMPIANGRMLIRIPEDEIVQAAFSGIPEVVFFTSAAPMEQLVSFLRKMESIRLDGADQGSFPYYASSYVEEVLHDADVRMITDFLGPLKELRTVDCVFINASI